MSSLSIIVTANSLNKRQFGRDPQTGLVAISPSGVLYDVLKPEDLVVVDLDGRVVEGSRQPSTDTASHLYVYRYRPDLFGVTHTHSNYATAFAAVGGFALEPTPIPHALRGLPPIKQAAGYHLNNSG